ncbi:MAG: YidC/Oxa1 family membrane protein insertase [Clostridia bacterium]|nr:YidC/Oxa1 family membrane protein insertase [Clostridia bacterium]
MDFLTKPIGWIINLCYKLIPNYAIALLLFAIIIKLVLFPFGIKQQKNMLKQAKLRPKEQAIRKRYAGRDDKVTRQKMQEDLMKLYQQEGYNPASGCLPMILQLVIVFAVYGVMQNPLTHVSHLSNAEINKIGVGIVEMCDQGILDEKDFSGNAWKSISEQLKKVEKKGDSTPGVTDEVTDDTTGVDTTTGDTTTGDTTAVDTTTGDTTVGDTTVGDTTVGDTTTGDITPGDTTNNETGAVTTDNIYADVKSPSMTQVELVRVIRNNFDEFKANGCLPKGFTRDDLPKIYLWGNSVDLSVTPSLAFNWYLLIPILTFVFTFGSMKLTKKFTYQSEVQQQTADAGCAGKIMDYVMPLMSTFITFSVPSIIAVYWIYNNVLSLVQQIALKYMYPVPVFTEEDYKRAEIEMNKGVKHAKKSGSGKRAAHRIDLDDDDGAEEKPKPEKKAKEDPKAGLITPGQMKDESDKESDEN